MKNLMFLVMAMFMGCAPAFAGFHGYNGTTDLKVFDGLKCSTGISCVRVKGHMDMTVNGAQTAAIAPTFGMTQYDVTAPLTSWSTWLPKVAVTEGTSTTPSTTTTYLSQVFVPVNTLVTGINVLNAATVGTNSWTLAIFDDTGAPLATTLLTGTTTSGASAFQQIALTAPITLKGPGTYWLGGTMNGTTDRFYTIPAAGAWGGLLAGSVTGQTFGSVVAVTLPTTFTTAKGIIAYTY